MKPSVPLITPLEERLIVAIQSGFPISSRPFLEIGRQIDRSEAWVIATLSDLQKRGAIKRMGIIVRHMELGYRANAMIVWDVPDQEVDRVGRQLSNFDFINLCYQRRRCPPQWPFNLYCMIHGRERQEVLNHLESLTETCRLHGHARQVLFSCRRFKQRGAHYFARPNADEGTPE